MKRRLFTTQLMATGLGLGAVGAQAQGGPVEGKHYVRLAQPQPVAVPGKIEVVEFFWYACPHCNAFEPALESWVKQLPKDVAFRRAPVAFRNDFVPLQKLYYALEALGKVDELHRKAFYAIHVDKQRLNTDDTVIAWAASQGLDKAKFTETYNSFNVATKVRKATQLQDAYKLAGVPAIGINGRYYTDGTLAQNMNRALTVTDQLIAEQRGKAKS